MIKSKTLRVGGFVGGLCASAALVAGTVGMTGAYFTASQSGNLYGKSGHLSLTTSNPSLSFTDLVPGTPKTQSIGYKTDSSGNTDLWMVFTPTDQGYIAFTGADDQEVGTTGNYGGLGGYGFFQVQTNGTNDFVSYNLKNLNDTGTVPGNDACPVNANGDGGSYARATGPDNGSQAAPECGVPADILLASNLPTGSTGNIEVSFGLTGKAKAQNTVFANVPFKIVATQHGVRPDAQNF